MRNRDKRKRLLIWLTFFAIMAAAAILIMWRFFILPNKTYTAEDFGIKTLKSDTDFNNNGTDDYTDIMLGARKDAENHPTYDGRYWNTAYPPDDIGVCTDVVWRAFKNAGYNLREMVDKDINKHIKEYPNVETPDSNIDFRRVKNLKVYFDTYAQKLTTDVGDISDWQPGDIVIFGDNTHIGIISDKRNSDGIAYVIHNAGQPNREEDYLSRCKPAAHYRFDAGKIDKNMLVKWEE